MRNYFENMSQQKKDILVVLPALGITFAKSAELGPLLFPYNYIDSPRCFQYVACFFIVYYIVQYVLIHWLLRGSNYLRQYHFILLLANLCISVASVLIFKPNTSNEIFEIIHYRRHVFTCEVVAIGTLIVSTIVALIKSSKAKSPDYTIGTP